MELDGEKKVTLLSSDGEEFEVDEAAAVQSQTIRHLIEDDEAAAVQSQTIRHLIEDGCTHSRIPLPNVTSQILAKVIQYCNKRVDAYGIAGQDGASRGVEDEAFKAWEAEFVMVDQATLFDLIPAANYMNIKPLLDLTCQTLANMIKGKTPEEIRRTFNIKNDFTPEEEEEIDEENQWAFE